MKQIITQHGWGLNKYFWDDYKVDFLNNNWHWQDNERGYFYLKNQVYNHPRNICLVPTHVE